MRPDFSLTPITSHSLFSAQSNIPSISPSTPHSLFSSWNRHLLASCRPRACSWPSPRRRHHGSFPLIPRHSPRRNRHHHSQDPFHCSLARGPPFRSSKRRSEAFQPRSRCCRRSLPRQPRRHQAAPAGAPYARPRIAKTVDD